jgi:Protein of unknown function (DUF3277)
VGTYSFINVLTSLSGPGGAFAIGYGSGAAKEGITAEMLEDKDMLTIGADGAAMHSLRANNGARVTIRLLKTAPTNGLLSNLYNFQRTSSANWGQNIIRVTDVIRGDVCSGNLVAFARQPTITWAEDGNFNEWSFLAGVWNEILGFGTPDINTGAVLQ